VADSEQPQAVTLSPRGVYGALGMNALTLVSQAASSVTVELAGNTAEPDELVTVTGGKQLRIVSYFDGTPGHDSLTEQIVQKRQVRYYNAGIWSDVDVEDDVRGDNVEIVALVDPETGEPVASLRKIHTTGADLQAMPSYAKFEAADAFTEDGQRFLHERAAANRPVVEIAALWKDPNYKLDVTAELYRRAFQASVKRGELWFAGAITPEYKELRRTYGGEVVHVVGEPIPVNDGKANEKIRLHAVVIDPESFFVEMVDQIETARAKPNTKVAASLEMWMWYYANGIESRLDHESLERMDRLQSVRAA
jgi:hypothetical protein